MVVVRLSIRITGEDRQLSLLSSLLVVFGGLCTLCRSLALGRFVGLHVLIINCERLVNLSTKSRLILDPSVLLVIM
jgi:hypothetical protein